jgi:hypothetical protein
MLGRGLVNRLILKAVRRGKKINVIKRYLYMCHNINLGDKALKNRYERIKVFARQGVQ